MTHTATSTAVRPADRAVPRILVVGGGYAGFYTAWKLEKHLRKGEADNRIKGKGVSLVPRELRPSSPA